MSWLDYVENNTFLKILYPGQPPRLDGIRLHRVLLHQDGPSVSLGFELNEYPKDPPVKWTVAAHNTVMVLLEGSGIQQMSLVGWALNNIGDLHIQQADAGFALGFGADECRLDAQVRFLRVVSVSALHVDRRVTKSDREEGGRT